MTTPLFVLCFLFLEGLLALITHGRATNGEIVLLGRLVLVWSYSTILTHGVTKAFFLMSGHERGLVRLLMLEAFANISLTFLLLQWLDQPIGAALGSLLPALAIGWLLLWPWAAREIGLTPWGLMRAVLLPALRSALPVIAFGTSWHLIASPSLQTNAPVFLAVATVAATLTVWGTWRFGLSEEERVRIAERISELRTRGRQARPWFS